MPRSRAHRRRGPAVGVAAILLLAGCGSMSFGGQPVHTQRITWFCAPMGQALAPLLGVPIRLSARRDDLTDGTVVHEEYVSMAGATLVVEDALGVPVPGEVTSTVPEVLEFRPSVPLRPGVAYSALAQTAAGRVRWTFVPILPDGLDPAFEVPRFESTRQPAIAVTASGAVVGDSDRVLKLDEAGRPDAAFGSGGWAGLPTGLVPDLVVDAAGRVLGAGTLLTEPGAPWVAFALLADGSLDPAFGVEGAGRVTEGAPWHVSRVRQAADGCLLVGSFDSVVRLTPNGSVDQAFGTGGALRFADGWLAFEPLMDGGLLTASYRPLQCEWLLERFDAVGVAQPFGSACLDRRLALAVDASGRTLGLASTTALRRFTADGAPDPAFGDAGLMDLRPILGGRSAMDLVTAGGWVALLARDVGNEALAWLDPSGALDRLVPVPPDVHLERMAFDAARRLHVVATVGGGLHRVVLRFPP